MPPILAVIEKVPIAVFLMIVVVNEVNEGEDEDLEQL